MSVLLAIAVTAAALGWGVAVVSAVRAHYAARRSGQPDAGRAFYSWFAFARKATGAAATEARRTHLETLAFAAAWVIFAVCGIILALGTPADPVASPAA